MKSETHIDRNNTIGGLVRYSIAGMSGTAVEWGLFFVLNQLLHLYYPFAAHGITSLINTL